MSKKILAVVFILVLVGVLFAISKNTVNLPGILVSPGVGRTASQPAAPAPTLAAPNAPQEIKYGSSTNLKQELDNINPQVLDSDFE
ncbi:hypothetical protein M1437_03680 [Patescibacteria group bacterium]|nr:hypothetical protein [Patescibacteria group bacterium]